MIRKSSNGDFVMGKPKYLSQELGEEGVLVLLKIICKAYYRIKEKNIITATMSEPEITEELYFELLEVWKNAGISSFRPIHEKSHGRRKKGRGKTPTIDFCFRIEWDPHIYFGSECKLLKENDIALYNRYIQKGMKRYLKCRYGKKFPDGSMVGYIVEGDIATVIQEIKIRVNEISIGDMRKIKKIKSFNGYYKSEHRRACGHSPFSIHHLFLSFD